MSTDNFAWLVEHSIEIQKKYPGKWIAVHDGAVIGVGDTAPEAVEQAEQKAPGADYILEAVDTDYDVIYSLE